MIARKHVTSKSYTPFGEQIGEAASGFGYNGEYYNAATGMIYLRARFYEPELNRFSQKDILRGSVIQPGSLNRYLYCQNDPVNYSDPSGMRQVAGIYGDGTGRTSTAKQTTPIVTKPGKNKATSAAVTSRMAAVPVTDTGTGGNRSAASAVNKVSTAKKASAQSAQSTTTPIPMPQPGPPPVLSPVPQYWNPDNSSALLPPSVMQIRGNYACEAGAYNREAAIEYARTWVGNTDTAITNNADINAAYDFLVNSSSRNPEFYNYKTNCANYVSQCLLAGGIDMTEEWHTNPTSISLSIKDILIGNLYSFRDTGKAWAQANGQYLYFDDLYGHIEIVNQNSQNEDAIQISKAINENIIQAGDLLYFVEQENGREIVDHATIISSVTGQEILYAGNTISRFDMELSEALQSDNYVRVYIIHIN